MYFVYILWKETDVSTIFELYSYQSLFFYFFVRLAKSDDQT